ncbi:MAG: D-alanine--D-alanine ligase [Thermoguttaceae bacterium]|jgi:D-alanine-D-alanine ligase|nr:D-alanine--D-alanine ligase [Thermoguttaceae bacterium]
MHIGLTYDLRKEYLAVGYSEEETAEFDRPDTIDAIEGTLQSLGHATDRIGNAWRLVERLAAGDRWDLVFNIAEGLRGNAREAQIPAVLDVYDIPYAFSDPLVLAVGLDKGLSKLVVREAGVPTPDFAVVRSAADLDAVDLTLPLFAKPLAEGTGKGITSASKIDHREDLWPVCEDLLRRFPQGVLLESFLPGRELTVGLLGTGKAARVLGTLEIVLRDEAEADVYSYVNKERCEELVEYRLVRPEGDPEVAQAEAMALRAWRALGCRDGGRIDLRSDAQGRPNFLEVNPLAGLHPEHSDLPILCTAIGIPYIELIREIIESAAARLNESGADRRILRV